MSKIKDDKDSEETLTVVFTIDNYHEDKEKLLKYINDEIMKIFILEECLIKVVSTQSSNNKSVEIRNDL